MIRAPAGALRRCCRPRRVYLPAVGPTAGHGSRSQYGRASSSTGQQWHVNGSGQPDEPNKKKGPGGPLKLLIIAYIALEVVISVIAALGVASHQGVFGPHAQAFAVHAQQRLAPLANNVAASLQQQWQGICGALPPPLVEAVAGCWGQLCAAAGALPGAALLEQAVLQHPWAVEAARLMGACLLGAWLALSLAHWRRTATRCATTPAAALCASGAEPAPLLVSRPAAAIPASPAPPTPTPC